MKTNIGAATIQHRMIGVPVAIKCGKITWSVNLKVAYQVCAGMLTGITAARDDFARIFAQCRLDRPRFLGSQLLASMIGMNDSQVVEFVQSVMKSPDNFNKVISKLSTIRIGMPVTFDIDPMLMHKALLKVEGMQELIEKAYDRTMKANKGRSRVTSLTNKQAVEIVKARALLIKAGIQVPTTPRIESIIKQVEATK